MFERGVIVASEPMRRGGHQFGPVIAVARRRHRPPPKDQGHLDERPLTIKGKTSSRWRAVDAYRMVLDLRVQERRNQEAAETVLRRVVEGSPEEPRVAVTDKLASDGPALKRGLPRKEPRQHQGLKNRQRERAMRRFQSSHQAQRFLEPLGPIREPFCPGRQTMSAHGSHSTLATRFVT